MSAIFSGTGLLAAVLCLAACGGAAPPGPEEQQRRLVRDAQPTMGAPPPNPRSGLLGRCGDASAMDRMAARDSAHTSSTEAFGARGCATSP